jgi:glucose/arabinose dehydrogenase
MKVLRTASMLLCLSALFVVLNGVWAQEATPEATPPAQAVPNSVEGNVLVTEMRPFSDALLNQLTLPDGFEITVFAQELGNARMIAVTENGTIFVSRPATNDVIALFDQNADGLSDVESFRVVASDIPFAHGLTIDGNQLYIAGEKQVMSAEILDDGSLGGMQVIADGLPDGDQHGRRTMALGADNALYIDLGSSCNACLESNPENATITRIPLDGSERSIFAEGLRNTLGFDFHPDTGALWGMDHGTDWRGDDQPPEELNLIEQGNNYGWPFCYGSQQVDVYIPYNLEAIRGITNEEFCASTTAPALEYQAHSAPISFKFYTGSQFPPEYANDAFVTMRGSWNRFPATGYKVVHVNFENGQPTEITDFVSGFLIEDGAAHFARLAGLAIMPDGSLLVSDDANGILYRIAYAGA